MTRNVDRQVALGEHTPMPAIQSFNAEHAKNAEK